MLELLAREPASLADLLVIDAHLCAQGMGAEPKHDGGGKRPGLRAEVAHLPDFDSDLFHGLPPHRVLQALPRLDEPGRHRVEPWPPRTVVLEQDPVLVIDDGGDDRRLDTREQQALFIVGIGARLGPSGQDRPHRGAAGGAEPLRALPGAHGDRAGGKTHVPRGGAGRKRPQLDPIEPLAQRLHAIVACRLRPCRRNVIARDGRPRRHVDAEIRDT